MFQKLIPATFLLASLVAATSAQAQPERRLFDGSIYRISGPTIVTHFGLDMTEGTDNDEIRFLVTLRSYEPFGSPEEFIPLADNVFEQYESWDQEGAVVAKVQLTYEEGPEWDAPSTTQVVEYHLRGDVWQRISHVEIPVRQSEAFPFQPSTPLRLSSGETIHLLPMTRGIIRVGFMNREERETLYLRVVVGREFADLSSGDEIIYSVWSEVLHDILMEQGDNYVSVIFHTEFPTSRFDFSDALRISMPLMKDGTWPDLGLLVDQIGEVEPSGAGITRWQ